MGISLDDLADSKRTWNLRQRAWHVYGTERDAEADFRESGLLVAELLGRGEANEVASFGDSARDGGRAVESFRKDGSLGQFLCLLGFKMAENLPRILVIHTTSPRLLQVRSERKSFGLAGFQRSCNVVDRPQAG